MICDSTTNVVLNTFNTFGALIPLITSISAGPINMITLFIVFTVSTWKTAIFTVLMVIALWNVYKQYCKLSIKTVYSIRILKMIFHLILHKHFHQSLFTILGQVFRSNFDLTLFKSFKIYWSKTILFIVYITCFATWYVLYIYSRQFD